MKNVFSTLSQAVAEYVELTLVEPLQTIGESTRKATRVMPDGLSTYSVIRTVKQQRRMVSPRTSCYRRVGCLPPDMRHRDLLN